MRIELVINNNLISSQNRGSLSNSTLKNAIQETTKYRFGKAQGHEESS